MRARRLTALIAVVPLAAAAGAPTAHAASSVRIWAGSTTLTDAAGRHWRPAHDAIDGRRVPIRRELQITASPRLYATLADGVSRVRLRLPEPGRYAVTLYLAEPRKLSTPRRFSVRAPDVRESVDVPVGTGLQRPVHSAFETVARGRTLTLRFRAIHGRPVVAAVEAQRLGPVDTGAIAPWFGDAFDGTAGALPGTASWTAVTGSRWGAKQLQSYTARPGNVALDGQGNLVVTARAEQFTNPDGFVADYTSGRVQSTFTTPLTRAKVTARMRIPDGAGLWSTFWAMGVEPPVWPASGEVDIAEFAGQRSELLYGFVHGPLTVGNGLPYQNGAVSHARRSFSGGLHEYGIRTEPGVVQFLLDGNRYGSVSRADIPKGAPWLLSRPYHLVFSLAVGGFGGTVGSRTAFPAQMVVDRVSIWR